MLKPLRREACTVHVPLDAWIEATMIEEVFGDAQHGGKLKAHERFMGHKSLVTQPDLNLFRSTVFRIEQSALPILWRGAVDAVDPISTDDVKIPVVDTVLQCCPM